MQTRDRVEYYISLFDREDELRNELKEVKDKLLDNPVPSWILKSYKKIYDAIGTEPFKHSDAQKILNRTQVAQYLKELRRYGLCKWKKDKKDLRITIYQLKNVEESDE